MSSTSETTTSDEKPHLVFQVSCYECNTIYNAITASWCQCVAKERSLICPNCGRCFCTAPRSYKQRFWVDAPRELWHSKAVHQRPSALPQNPSPDDVRRPLICVVDDDTDILVAAYEVISRLGVGVIVAGDGQEAVALVETYHPDLVLTDALMPKLDGRELCLTIKSSPSTASTRVVIMTSVYTTGVFKREAMTVFKADDFLAKPVSEQTLFAMLVRHINLPDQDETTRANDEAIEETVQPQIESPPPATVSDSDVRWLQNIGLSGDLLRAFGQHGGALTLEDVAALHLLGMSPDYVDRMHRAFNHRRLTGPELAALHEHGIDDAYAALCRTIGNVTPEEMIELKRAGVDHDFLHALVRTETKGLTVLDVVSCRRLGIDGPFLSRIAGRSDTKTFRDLVRLHVLDRRTPAAQDDPVDAAIAKEAQKYRIRP